MKDFKPIFLVAIGIIVIWFLFRDSGGLLGGLSSGTSGSGSSNRGDTSETISAFGAAFGTSPFAGQVELRVGGAHRDDRDREYIELRATDDIVGAVTISGWTLRNETRNKEYEIPVAPRIGYPFKKLAGGPVTLSQDEEAYVITGPSPIATSFKTNECTGYFQDRGKSFRPSLARNCPAPEERRVLKKFNLENNDECIDFLDSIPKCTDYKGLPNYDEDDDRAISRRCEEYVAEEVTYEGCVRNNITTSDFYGSEWYLYLDVHFTIDEIWKDDNVVLLLDQNGRVVDELSL